MEQTEYTPAEKDDGADVEVVDPNVPIRQAPTPALGQTRTASGKLATSHRGQALGKYQQTFSSRGEAYVLGAVTAAWWHACTSLVLMCVLLRLQKGGEGYPADLSALWLGPVSCFVDV